MTVADPGTVLITAPTERPAAFNLWTTCQDFTTRN